MVSNGTSVHQGGGTVGAEDRCQTRPWRRRVITSAIASLPLMKLALLGSHELDVVAAAVGAVGYDCLIACRFACGQFEAIPLRVQCWVRVQAVAGGVSTAACAALLFDLTSASYSGAGLVAACIVIAYAETLLAGDLRALRERHGLDIPRVSTWLWRVGSEGRLRMSVERFVSAWEGPFPSLQSIRHLFLWPHGGIHPVIAWMLGLLLFGVLSLPIPRGWIGLTLVLTTDPSHSGAPPPEAPSAEPLPDVKDDPGPGGTGGTQSEGPQPPSPPVTPKPTLPEESQPPPPVTSLPPTPPEPMRCDAETVASSAPGWAREAVVELMGSAEEKLDGKVDWCPEAPRLVTDDHDSAVFVEGWTPGGHLAVVLVASTKHEPVAFYEDAALYVSEQLRDGIAVSGSQIVSLGAGDLQFVYVPAGTELLIKPLWWQHNASTELLHLPPAVTEAWMGESRRQGQLLWPFLLEEARTQRHWVLTLDPLGHHPVVEVNESQDRVSARVTDKGTSREYVASGQKFRVEDVMLLADEPELPVDLPAEETSSCDRWGDCPGG